MGALGTDHSSLAVELTVGTVIITTLGGQSPAPSAGEISAVYSAECDERSAVR
jgi:hypothetical protein